MTRDTFKACKVSAHGPYGNFRQTVCQMSELREGRHERQILCKLKGGVHFRGDLSK